jgi:alkaline phosphatase D
VTDAACPARLDPTLSLLGAAQERWLEDGLARSPARWNVIAQQTLMSPRTVRDRAGAPLHWTDGWDGYPAARRRFLDHLAQTRPGNPLVLGGDVHAFFVSDLRPDFDDPRSPVVGSELCGSSITSQGPVSARLDRLGAENPHLKFADGSARGYVAVTVGARTTAARLRACDSVKVPRPAIRTAASFAIEDGRPGPVKASS